MTYFLWHDKSRKQVNIHKDDCGDLEKLGGDRTQPPYYGPYCTLVAALSDATTFNLPVRLCGVTGTTGSRCFDGFYVWTPPERIP